ncbi:6393_t:CDS:2, partial [Ambispora leptoticha]
WRDNFITNGELGIELGNSVKLILPATSTVGALKISTAGGLEILTTVTETFFLVLKETNSSRTSHQDTVGSEIRASRLDLDLWFCQNVKLASEVALGSLSLTCLFRFCRNVILALEVALDLGLGTCTRSSTCFD